MMPLGEAFYRNKVAQIQAKLAEGGDYDGILLLRVPNVIYASGFLHTPSERPIGFYIPANGDPTLFVPLLEKENAADTWVGDIRTYFEYPGEVRAVEWVLTEIPGHKIAVDTVSPDNISAVQDGRLHLTTLIDEMRWIKSPEELKVTEQAARYADYCLQVVLNTAGDIIKDGGTELDILKHCLAETSAKMKAEVGELFKLRGSAVVGTVHSGPRAALPHGAPIARQPQMGETLIAGIGASVAGYHAESGATFVVGEASAETMRCLQAAVDCDAAAVNALKPGVTCASVNEAALNVLKESGLEDAIRHRIGHGMGLEGHESPWLAPGDETIVQPNMVFSNEPGIYRPGVDGYRTINTMIATEGEAKVASRFLAEHPPEKRILRM